MIPVCDILDQTNQCNRPMDNKPADSGPAMTYIANCDDDLDGCGMTTDY